MCIRDRVRRGPLGPAPYAIDRSGGIATKGSRAGGSVTSGRTGAEMSIPRRSDAATGRDPELTSDGTAAHDNPEAADRGATRSGVRVAPRPYGVSPVRLPRYRTPEAFLV